MPGGNAEVSNSGVRLVSIGISPSSSPFISNKSVMSFMSPVLPFTNKVIGPCQL